MTAGEQVRAARLRCGMTQLAVAKALNLDVTYISKIEKGAAKPGYESTKLMARLLLLDEAALLTGFGHFDAPALAAENERLRSAIQAAAALWASYQTSGETWGDWVAFHMDKQALHTALKAAAKAAGETER